MSLILHFSLLLTVSSLSLMVFHWHKVIKVDTLQHQVKWPWPFTTSEKTFPFFWNLYQLPRSWSDNGIKGNCISSAQLYRAMKNWGRWGSSEPRVCSVNSTMRKARLSKENSISANEGEIYPLGLTHTPKLSAQNSGLLIILEVPIYSKSTVWNIFLRNKLH